MPVVLLHPVGLDGRCWNRVALDGAIAYDLLAHGGRARPEPFTMAALAEDVVRRVEGPLDVVGLSMGGMVALQIAVRYPARVRSMVVACSTALTIPEVMLQRAEEAEREGMEGPLRATMERWFTPGALADLDHPGVCYARERLLANRSDDFAASWRAMSTYDVSSALHEIRAPVTAIAGEQDASVPVAALRAIAAGVSHGRLVVLRGPHMLQLEEPEALAAALREHLTRVRARA